MFLLRFLSTIGAFAHVAAAPPSVPRFWRVSPAQLDNISWDLWGNRDPELYLNKISPHSDLPGENLDPRSSRRRLLQLEENTTQQGLWTQATLQEQYQSACGVLSIVHPGNGTVSTNGRMTCIVNRDANNVVQKVELVSKSVLELRKILNDLRESGILPAGTLDLWKKKANETNIKYESLLRSAEDLMYNASTIQDNILKMLQLDALAMRWRTAQLRIDDNEAVSRLLSTRNFANVDEATLRSLAPTLGVSLPSNGASRGELRFIQVGRRGSACYLNQAQVQSEANRTLDPFPGPQGAQNATAACGRVNATTGGDDVLFDCLNLWQQHREEEKRKENRDRITRHATFPFLRGPDVDSHWFSAQNSTVVVDDIRVSMHLSAIDALHFAGKPSNLVADVLFFVVSGRRCFRSDPELVNSFPERVARAYLEDRASFVCTSFEADAFSWSNQPTAGDSVGEARSFFVAPPPPQQTTPDTHKDSAEYNLSHPVAYDVRRRVSKEGELSYLDSRQVVDRTVSPPRPPGVCVMSAATVTPLRPEDADSISFASGALGCGTIDAQTPVPEQEVNYSDRSLVDSGVVRVSALPVSTTVHPRAVAAWRWGLEIDIALLQPMVGGEMPWTVWVGPRVFSAGGISQWTRDEVSGNSGSDRKNSSKVPTTTWAELHVYLSTTAQSSNIPSCLALRGSNDGGGGDGSEEYSETLEQQLEQALNSNIRAWCDAGSPVTWATCLAVSVKDILTANCNHATTPTTPPPAPTTDKCSQTTPGNHSVSDDAKTWLVPLVSAADSADMRVTIPVSNGDWRMYARALVRQLPENTVRMPEFDDAQALLGLFWSGVRYEKVMRVAWDDAHGHATCVSVHPISSPRPLFDALLPQCPVAVEQDRPFPVFVLDIVAAWESRRGRLLYDLVPVLFNPEICHWDNGEEDPASDYSVKVNAVLDADVEWQKVELAPSLREPPPSARLRTTWHIVSRGDGPTLSKVACGWDAPMPLVGGLVAPRRPVTSISTALDGVVDAATTAVQTSVELGTSVTSIRENTTLHTKEVKKYINTVNASLVDGEQGITNSTRADSRRAVSRERRTCILKALDSTQGGGRPRASWKLDCSTFSSSFESGDCFGQSLMVAAVATLIWGVTSFIVVVCCLFGRKLSRSNHEQETSRYDTSAGTPVVRTTVHPLPLLRRRNTAGKPYLSIPQPDTLEYRMF
jgi:hypothetical protein